MRFRTSGERWTDLWWAIQAFPKVFAAEFLRSAIFLGLLLRYLSLGPTWPRWLNGITLALATIVLAALTGVFRVNKHAHHEAERLVKGRLQRQSIGDIDVVPLAEVELGQLNATIDETVARENGWDDESFRTLDRETTDLCGETGFAVRTVDPVAGVPRVIGAITLARIDPQLRNAEIGWWMGADARGKGLGKMGLGLAIDGFRRAGLESLIVGTAESNVAVHRSAEGLGGVLVRTGRHTLPNGSSVKSRWYRIGLAPDHPPDHPAPDHPADHPAPDH